MGHLSGAGVSGLSEKGEERWGGRGRDVLGRESHGGMGGSVKTQFIFSTLNPHHERKE